MGTIDDISLSHLQSPFTYHKFDCRDRASFKYQVGLILSRPHTPTNFLLNLLTGSTFELPLLPDMSTSENLSAWAASEKSTAAQRTVDQDSRKQVCEIWTVSLRP